MKRLASLTAVALATGLVAAIAYLRRGDLVLLALSLALTAAVHPVVQAMVNRRLPRALAVAITYVCGLSVLGALIAFVSGPLIAEARAGIDQFFAGYEHVRAHAPGGGELQRVLSSALPPASELYRGLGSSNPAAWAFGALGVTANAVQAVTQTMVVIVLSVYWAAADRPEHRVGTRLLSATGFEGARAAWTQLLSQVGDHMRVEIARTVVFIVLLGGGYRVLGLHYWMLPAIAAAVLGLIPFLGALLAMWVAASAAAAGGPIVVVLAVAYTAVIVLFVEAAIRRALHVQPTHPIVLVLSALALASSAGLVSILLAPPLAAVIESLGGLLLDADDEEPVAAALGRIEAKLRSLRAQADRAPPEAQTALAELIERTTRAAERIRGLAR